MIEGLTLAPAEFQPKPQPVINVLLVTVKQASEALQVSEKTIFNMIESGKLESVKIGDARRIPLEAIRRIATNGCELPTLAERATKPKRPRGRRKKATIQ
jgi:excisionase family DNA binding protein